MFSLSTSTRRFRWAALAGAAAALLVSGMPVAQAQQTYSFRYGHIGAVDSTFDKYAHKFASGVEAKTAGKVKIRVYPASQLGKQTELLDLVSRGALDFTQAYDGFMSALDKDFGVWIASFSVPSFEAREREEGPSGFMPEVYRRVEQKTKLHALAGFGKPATYYIWSKSRLIRTPEELKGVKLRFWEARSTLEVWKRLGANPTPIAWGDVYMAIGQGVVDGLVHTAVDVYDMKFYEQVKYASRVDLNRATVLRTYTNADRFASLAPEIRNAIEAASREANDYYNSLIQERETEAVKFMQSKGITFDHNTPQEPWFKAASPALKDLEKDGLWSSGLLEKVRGGQM